MTTSIVRRAGLLMAAVAFAAGTAGGQGGREARSWSHERLLHPGGVGPNRAAVDEALLAAGEPFRVERREGGTAQASDTWVASAGLEDLRLLDESGREIPYLLVDPGGTAPEWAASRAILPTMPTKVSSGFECDLGRPTTVDTLRVEGLPPPFLKRVRLEGSGDRVRWTVLVAEASLFHLPAEQLERLDLDFPGGSYRYLRATWNDASSARLPIPRSCLAREVTSHGAPAAVRASVPFEPRTSEPGVSRYRLRLPGPKLPVIAIELEVEGGNVLRTARVNEGRLAEGEVVPVTLGRGTLRRAVRESGAASDLHVAIEQPREPDLELVIDDGDNAPLQVRGVAVVFAQLPWIYFESADGTPIRAVYGARGLEAPRYDLEAARPTLDRAKVSEARWDEPKPVAGGPRPVEPGALPTGGAPIAISAFRFRRPIPAGPRGLTALALDPQVLANSRIADVRIATRDGRQVPYLLEKREEPLEVTLPDLQAAGADGPKLPQSSSGTRSVYRLQLPAANLPASRLVLKTPARVFDRAVAVVAASDRRGSRNGATTLAQARWKHADPDAPARPLTVELPPLPEPAVWLVVDEGDNQPLPVASASLLLPAYRLRFFRDTDDELQLVYGQDGLQAPRYDLALLAPTLLGAEAWEVRPVGETTTQPDPSARSTSLFWGALIVAAGVLLALVARLVGSKESPRER